MWSAGQRAALVATFTAVGILASQLLDRAGHNYGAATLGGIAAGGIALAAAALLLRARRRRRDRRANQTPSSPSG